MLSRRSRRSMRHRPFLRCESLEKREMLAVDLVITEVNYRPYAPTASELQVNGAWTASDFEFIEVMNNEPTPINLATLQFDAGVTFTFPPTTLNPGQFGVIVRNTSAFQTRYGTSPNLLGQFAGGGLTDGGEELWIVDTSIVPSDRVVQFTYSPSGLWPNLADGLGATLELIDNDTPNSRLSRWYSWRNSTEYGGSPGVAGMGSRGVVINEVLAHTDPPEYDSIELLNTTTGPIDIGGWYLSDSLTTLQKFGIPNGTVLPAGGYVTYSELDFNPTPLTPGPNDFGLNGAHGDDVFLTSGSGGSLQFIDTVEFEGSLNGVSFGRWPNGTGIPVPTQSTTFGSTNTPPRVGPLIISELNYRPGTANAAALLLDPTINRDDLEFVEVYNPTNQSLSLFEWDLGGAIDFTFPIVPTALILGPGEAVVIVSFDPVNPERTGMTAAFRANYGISESVRLLGPFDSHLDAGEDVVLLSEDEPPIEEPGFYPEIVADKVAFDDDSPWPTDADGNGPSLHRTQFNNFGSFGRSWVALPPSPGTVALVVTVLGDFSGNQETDQDDIEELDDQLRAGTEDLTYDVNGDGLVNDDDRAAWVTVAAGTHFGDANLDGLVDGRDYEEWSSNLGETNNEWKSGDFNGDRNVTDADYLAWEANRFRVGTRFVRRTSVTRTPRAAPTIPTLAAPLAAPLPASFGTGRQAELPLALYRLPVHATAPTDIVRQQSTVERVTRPFRFLSDDLGMRRSNRDRLQYDSIDQALELNEDRNDQVPLWLSR